MNRLIRLIDKFLEGGTLLSFLALVGVVVLQVFARFFLPQVPPWTEEASRIFFIYTVSFAAGLAVRDGAYVNVDLVMNLLRGKARAFLYLLLHGLVMIFMGVTFFYSLSFVRMGLIQKSPALGITASYLFASMALLSGTVILYTLHDMARDLCTLMGRNSSS